MKKSILTGLCSFFLLIPLFSVEVPYLTGRITDNAQLLSTETARQLTAELKAHEDSTTNQIAILTVPSLNGESIEDYAVAVFNSWKLGQKGKDNGILVVVAPNERSVRIEVGYGLESVMPDLLASRIIQNIMTPKFRESDYEGGIKDGTRAIIKVLEGKNIEGVSGSTHEYDQRNDSNSNDLSKAPLSTRILIGVFIYGIIGLFTIIGIVTPGGWFLYLFLIPFWAMFPMMIIGSNGALIGLIIYLILFPVLKIIISRSKRNEGLKNHSHKTKGGFMDGFFLSSGGSGGSWSSGGSSGFSGGGGSSGGGGASGHW